MESLKHYLKIAFAISATMITTATIGTVLFGDNGFAGGILLSLFLMQIPIDHIASKREARESKGCDL